MPDHKIGPAFAGVVMVSLLGISTGAATAAAAGSKQKSSAARDHHVYVQRRLSKRTYYNYAAPSPSANFESSYGRPPLQDPRDAWGGYFGDPDDNPHFHGSTGP